jgi:transposase-like protein
MASEKNKHQPKFTRQMTFGQFDRLFPDEEACKLYLSVRRWPEGVRCPRCSNDHVYASKARPWHWQCKKCGKDNRSPYRFSLLTGTVFEETKISLLVWFKVTLLMLTSKKGISALQIHRLIGTGSYKTAWYMCHRVRAALSDPEFQKLIESESELVQIQGQIFDADVVIGADNATLQKTPERFDIVRVDLAAHVFQRPPVAMLQQPAIAGDRTIATILLGTGINACRWIRSS